MEKINRDLQEIIKSVKTYLKAQQLAGLEDFYLKAVPLASSLDKLREEVAGCQLCPLYKTRTNPVFGQGNPKAKIVFVGEAPGREEDRQGLPFVGRAGELLTKIIQAMGLKRQDVYICNVLKCRPPENRNPLPAEVIACQDYLKSQLEMIKPQVICCMGKFACQAMLGEDISISKIRGNFYQFQGIKVMPTFHPAYLLRNPGAKRLVWEDMKKVMAELRRT